MNSLVTAIRSRVARLLGRGQPAAPQAQPPTGLTPEHVVWAYRLFLDREPEHEGAVREKLQGWSTTQGLRSDFMTSSEFQQKNTGLGYAITETIVIKELDERLRLFVDLSDYVIGLGIVQGNYEIDEISLIKQIVKPGDVVLDIGANIGLFAIVLGGLVGEHGHVYAFEPLPRNSSLLARSIAENGFGERVTLERAAVGHEPGHMNLVAPRQTLNWGGPYLHRPGTEVPAGHDLLQVPIIQLDAYPLRRPVTLIKIDVEGAEPLALRGAARVLAEDKPVILSEINPVQLQKVANCSAAAFLGEMRALGYGCYQLEHGRVGAPVGEVAIDTIISVVFVHQHSTVPQLTART